MELRWPVSHWSVHWFVHSRWVLNVSSNITVAKRFYKYSAKIMGDCAERNGTTASTIPKSMSCTYYASFKNHFKNQHSRRGTENPCLWLDCQVSQQMPHYASQYTFVPNNDAWCRTSGISVICSLFWTTFLKGFAARILDALIQYNITK
jgi:hypothetical protein